MAGSTTALNAKADKHGTNERTPIAGEAFLRALADHGVDYLFANPGTDFPPVVEAYSRCIQTNAKVPKPFVIPHEAVAVSMAHGAYAMTGRVQAVMLHVNVGTANAISNVINFYRDNVPLILAAGGTPVTEKGAFGSRNRYIHWAQEMFDQGGMLRETVKWDYVLRTPDQAADAVSRAHEIAMTSPRGPVYMVLPREPLAAPLSAPIAPVKPRNVPSAPRPDQQGIETLAAWIAAAKQPLIITTTSGTEAMGALARIAERYAIPVVTQRQRVVCLPSSHPMHMGYDTGDLISHADLAIVIEADVPWIPGEHQPQPACRIATIGEDPAFSRFPMRSFPSDLAITATAASALAALETALAGLAVADAPVTARRKRTVEHNAKRHAQLAKAAEPNGDAITPAYLSRMIGEAVGPDAVIFNEYTLMQDHCPREKPDTFFGLSPAGGLGWGLGAALGARLAAPDKFVVAVLGDGAYMFNNPIVCHWVAQTYKLPVLAIVFNNSRYGAVRGATLSMFKHGVAGDDDGRFMADLNPSPPFDAMVAAQGGHAERVERAADLPDALARAREAVLNGQQAFLNVICHY